MQGTCLFRPLLTLRRVVIGTQSSCTGQIYLKLKSYLYIYLLVFICYFIFSLYNTLVAGIHTRVRIVIFGLLFAQIGPFSDHINLSTLTLVVLLLSLKTNVLLSTVLILSLPDEAYPSNASCSLHLTSISS